MLFKINFKKGVIPTYKKADPAIFSNYRQVSLLSCFFVCLFVLCVCVWGGVCVGGGVWGCVCVGVCVCVFSKILEKLVFDRWVNFINNQEILNDKQYGFRPQPIWPIAQLVDKITNAVEKRKRNHNSNILRFIESIRYY